MSYVYHARLQRVKGTVKQEKSSCMFCGKAIGPARYWAVMAIKKQPPETCSRNHQHALAVYRSRGAPTPAERAKAAKKKNG
jgi:hypothetical protein